MQMLYIIGGLATAILWGIATELDKWLLGTLPITAVLLFHCVAMIVVLGLYLLYQMTIGGGVQTLAVKELWRPVILGVLAGVGVVNVAAFYLYYKLMKGNPTYIVIALMSTTPLFLLGWAALTKGRASIKPAHFIGVVMVVTGIILLLR